MSSPNLLEQVIELAARLDENDREVLIEHLQQFHGTSSAERLNLPVIDVGEWPENLSLRREDWYGDDGR